MISYTYTAQMVDEGISTAKTIVQLKAGARLRIIRAWCSQRSQLTNALQRIALVRKSVAATVTGVTPLKLSTSLDPSLSIGGTTATGVNATSEGTDTDILYSDAFNTLFGWLYLPAPEERIYLEVGEIIGLKLIGTPAYPMNIHAGFVWEEAATF